MPYDCAGLSGSNESSINSPIQKLLVVELICWRQTCRDFRRLESTKVRVGRRWSSDERESRGRRRGRPCRPLDVGQPSSRLEISIVRNRP